VPSIEERKVWRDNYLIAFYELTSGDGGNWVTHRDVATKAGIPENEVFAIGRFQREQGYLQTKSNGTVDALVSITAAGVLEAEYLIEKREETGEPLYVGHVALNDADLIRRLEPLLAQIREALERDTELDPDTRSDVQSDLASVEVQTKARHPNRGVIRESLNRMKEIWPHLRDNAIFAAAIVGIIRGIHG
jgi:hypothetical protein